jgi:hypothetical protein
MSVLCLGCDVLASCERSEPVFVTESLYDLIAIDDESWDGERGPGRGESCQPFAAHIDPPKLSLW